MPTLDEANRSRMKCVFLPSSLSPLPLSELGCAMESSIMQSERDNNLSAHLLTIRVWDV